MNFAHIIGQHHFENQWTAIAHYAVTWAPVVLVVTALIIGLYLRAQAQRNSLATERKRR